MTSPAQDTGFLSDVVWPAKVEAIAQFDLDGLLRLIAGRGVRALWQPAVQCPCGDPAGNSPSQECPACGNTGWIFPLSQEVRLIATSMRDRLDLYGEKANIMIPGSVSLACRYEHAPTLFDRITMLNNRIGFSDLQVRRAALSVGGAAAVERLRYPIFAKTYPKRTGGEASLDVVYIIPQALDGYPRRTQQGALAPLVKGTDFDITVQGWIDWKKGDVRQTAPAVGAPFAIYYFTRPVFRVIDCPQVSRDTLKNWKVSSEQHQYLPVEFTGQLEWLWRAT
jgi:hypothetical protein